jgi:hypothetical protein
MSQITPDIGMHDISNQNQNSAEKSGIVQNNSVDGLHHDGSQSRLLLDGEFLNSVALFTVEQTLRIHQICSMELKSGLLAPPSAEQIAFSASFVFITRSTKAPSAWKAIPRSSCSLNDNG